MKQMIDQFATCDLFGRGNYEYYARVTGRILKVQDEWICSFQYPPPPRGELFYILFLFEYFRIVKIMPLIHTITKNESVFYVALYHSINFIRQ